MHHRHTRRSRRHRHATNHPGLRFTPYAWAKLLFLRDAGPTEVGGFGIAAAEDLLLVEDVRLVTQICTRTSVLFEDAAVADYFDACVDAGMPPERFARIWIHTHPGASAEPSQTDEQTFARVFGGCDWSVMAILSREGECYSRLRFNAGPGGELRLPIDVAYDIGFRGTDSVEWETEYRDSISLPTPAEANRTTTRPAEGRDLAAATAELQLSTADRFSRADFADVPASDFDFWGFDDDDDCYASE